MRHSRRGPQVQDPDGRLAGRLNSREMRIGEERLGQLARSQIEAVRRDPRLGRERGASVADFWDAMEEAERVRTLGVWGLHELEHALEREEERLGGARTDADLPDALASQLQAAWERSEMARLELANGHPHLNAQALLSMNSALDALVEEFVPAMRAIRVDQLVDQVFRRAEQQEPEAARELRSEARERLVEATRHVLATSVLPKLKQMRGSGIERYEPLLAQEGLAAPSDRPIPDDLSQAIAELGALRDVLMHRAGRVDLRALEQVPSLRYHEGGLVRISPDEYRLYSAALRCYSAEIIFRSIRNWPETSDENDGPNLANWRNYYVIGA
jgi:hypothetical protein